MTAYRWAAPRFVLLLVALAACVLGLTGGVASATPPAASFTMSPDPAVVDQTVTFTDTSTDPDGGTIVARGWDINGDGVISDPLGAPVVQRTYHTAGMYTITLRVTDSQGETATLQRTLQVGTSAPPPDPTPTPTPAPLPTPTPTPASGPSPSASNRTPVAAFTFSPFAPTVGALVSSTSGSSDADGSLVHQLWDLDGDGQFDDAAGATVQIAYATAGSRAVSLKVTDDRGASAVAFQTVPVIDAPAGAASGAPTPAATNTPTTSTRTTRTPLLAPFPIVRIRGQVIGSAVRLSVLSVRAPARSTVTVRCSGRGCPVTRSVQRAGSRTRTVRLARLERTLRAGTVLRVSVTRAGTVGKYTEFRLRKGRAPARRDLCLRDGSPRPSACPAA
ncbi:PKD domain-containing protein [Baekduia soli]|uniref:PKD domain-containing protein n=1 Tax=Baekduia soli TaxID=496014 RepID=A0A5B8U059_9ACTN|nr:PKD domain-containing protein [Baekduia soli]QEC46345.1 PKD domain-containing protein [Baekduia soli]